MIQELIDKARAKQPTSIYYTGRLSEEEIIMLEDTCEIHCQSLYMDGSATYSIKYRENKE